MTITLPMAQTAQFWLVGSTPMHPGATCTYLYPSASKEGPHLWLGHHQVVLLLCTLVHLLVKTESTYTSWGWRNMKITPGCLLWCTPACLSCCGMVSCNEMHAVEWMLWCNAMCCFLFPFIPLFFWGPPTTAQLDQFLQEYWCLFVQVLVYFSPLGPTSLYSFVFSLDP